MPSVIHVDHISKQYRLGQIGTGTLSHDLNRWWHQMRGKDDPYLRIGEENERTQKGDSDYAWALRDVSFEVEQGSVLGIIGRNGAGKSTLLKILSRTTAPTTGEIKIRGRVASLLEVGTGFHPDLTGRENVFLNGAILGMSRLEINRKFDEIVSFAGVERYIDTPVKRYSSGMYVRLAFGVAAHLEPEILIVDEVLAVGDIEFQKKALGKMKDVSKNDGRTVLFVSHNLQAVELLCTHGIYMKNGTVREIGSPREVINHYLNESRPEFSFGVTSPVDLNPYVRLEAFHAEKNPLRTFETLSIRLAIRLMDHCIIDSVCLLIYNDLNERMAIVDLRETLLKHDLKSAEHFSFRVLVDQLNLVEGEYNIGLYLNTDKFETDFNDLWKLVVDNKLDSVVSYSKKARGHIELKYSVEVDPEKTQS